MGSTRFFELVSLVLLRVLHSNHDRSTVTVFSPHQSDIVGTRYVLYEEGGKRVKVENPFTSSSFALTHRTCISGGPGIRRNGGCPCSDARGGLQNPHAGPIPLVA